MGAVESGPEKSAARYRVFIAGVTGYMGTRLAEELMGRGHSVAGLVRPGSENQVPTGVCRSSAMPWTATRSATKLPATTPSCSLRVLHIPALRRHNNFATWIFNAAKNPWRPRRQTDFSTSCM
jgi:nucleoside-diphosphate-sugar epimerase